jgi:pyruvate/2-oxoacid:ferredoxin oxidoreductase alpha subunit
MVEGNATHQAERLIREHTGMEFKERINHYDGRPFYAEDIVDYVVKGVT